MWDGKQTWEVKTEGNTRISAVVDGMSLKNHDDRGRNNFTQREEVWRRRAIGNAFKVFGKEKGGEIRLRLLLLLVGGEERREGGSGEGRYLSVALIFVRRSGLAFSGGFFALAQSVACQEAAIPAVFVQCNRGKLRRRIIWGAFKVV